MLRRAIVHRFPRRKVDVSDAAFSIDTNAGFEIVAGSVRVSFDQPVNVNSLPPYRKNGVLPLTVGVISASQFDLTYAALPETGDTIVVPQRSKSVRTVTGGYVNPVTAKI